MSDAQPVQAVHTVSQAIEALYEDGRANAADICEHMPRLRELAAQCAHVTEMGVRWANGSTRALLAGLSDRAEGLGDPLPTLVSWDIAASAILRCFQLWENLTDGGRAGKLPLTWQPRVGSTRDITIETTDLLFIDTLHTHEQLDLELWRHARYVEKFLVLHDTETFGAVGEDGKAPGLQAAVQTFLDAHHRGWYLSEKYSNNNGLMVLAKKELRGL